jgi:hypothetical protein
MLDRINKFFSWPAASALKPSAQRDAIVVRLTFVRPKQEAKNNREYGCGDNYEKTAPFHATNLFELRFKR